MFDERNLTYCYDGSFDGFLCCVFESFLKKEMPAAIFSEEELIPTLFAQKNIETDPAKAERVFSSLEKKISPEASQLVQDGFLTCVPQKERILLLFLQKGFQYGRGVMDRLADPDVAPLMDAVKALGGEAHLLLGFLRFSDRNGFLTAVISPKNCVLPKISGHFCSRFNAETFLIYDKTHRMALLYQSGKAHLIPLESFTPPPPDAKEEAYRALWKSFYRTIAVEGRDNPRCRMTHMPKRFWADTVELRDEAPRLRSPEMPAKMECPEEVPLSYTKNSQALLP